MNLRTHYLTPPVPGTRHQYSVDGGMFGAILANVLMMPIFDVVAVMSGSRFLIVEATVITVFCYTVWVRKYECALQVRYRWEDES